MPIQDTLIVATDRNDDEAVVLDGNDCSMRVGSKTRAGTVYVNNSIGHPNILIAGRSASITVGGIDGQPGSFALKNDLNEDTVVFDGKNGDVNIGSPSRHGSMSFSKGPGQQTIMFDASVGEAVLGGKGTSGFVGLNQPDGTARVGLSALGGAGRFFSSSGTTVIEMSADSGQLNINHPDGQNRIRLSSNDGSAIFRDQNGDPIIRVLPEAKSIIIDAKAVLTADHVFEPGYDLMSLSDLSDFVASKKHLPGVPSASEIRKEGLDLVRFNSLLLEKIEELTLHIFALERRITALESATTGTGP